MTTLIAIYGAVLSTLALGWNIYKWYCERPSLLVDAKIMREVPDIDGKDRLVVSATNQGHRPVNVKLWGVKVSGGFRVVDTGKLPRKLEEGDSFSDVLPGFEDIFSEPVKSLLFVEFSEREWHLKRSRLRRLVDDVKKSS